MRLGVLGGTFDPVHLGHLILAHCAAEQLKLDRVLFLPAGDPWRKAAQAVTAARHRLEMLRLAIAGDERFQVDDREIRRQGPTYTSETLQGLREELGTAADLFFILGEDALEDMRHWHKPEGILANARLAVAPRIGAGEPPPAVDHERIEMPYIGISATDLRERTARGQSLRYFVPDAVREYIETQGLYKMGA